MENWRIILDKARKALSSHVEWKSLGEQTKYRFKEIEDERIKIELLGGGKDVTIGHMGAIRAMNKLRLNGSLYKSELITGVVRQTALVFLHPYITTIEPKESVGKSTLRQLISSKHILMKQQMTNSLKYND
jgi:hypothetical protein